MATFHALLLLCLIPLSQLCLSDRCHPNDKKVLFQIKKALNNPYHLASWTKDTDCCDWYVVKCDEKTNRIRSLSIDDAEITGQIPAAVGDLPSLEYLGFTKVTNLTGHIQPAIAKLTNLKSLWLSYTFLSGPIPSFIGDLKNLDYLNLNFNQLTGTIPPSLSKLTKLGGLRLEGNKLTGPILESFAKIPYLYLSRNQLSGPIPKSFANLNYIELIDLSRNKFSGDASHLFSSRKKVFKADLSRNMFAFDLTKVVLPDSLAYLDLNHNKIYGSLPESLTKTYWQTFNVSYNRLCGKIPTGGRLQELGQTAYFHNKCLCGAPLPACL